MKVMEKEALEKFIAWQKQMWIDLKRHLKQWEIEKRPNFFLGYDKAKHAHIENFNIEFKLRTEKEIEAIETVYKK